MSAYDWHYEKSTPHALDQVAQRLEVAQQQNHLQPSYQSEYPHSPMNLGGGYFDGNELQVPATANGNIAIDAKDKAQQKSRYTFYNELPSLPFMQFMSQAARERQRLDHQSALRLQGRRQTLPWDVTIGPQGSAENNIRRSWMNQGIWAMEWGPAWPEHADVLFSQDRPEPGEEREIPGHPFMDLRWEVDVFKPFPNSWGHEKPEEVTAEALISFRSAQMAPPDLGPPEKLIPQVPEPGASTPAAQFESQVVKERDWIRDEMDFQNNGEQVDLDARARESVRESWILDGIWRPEWDQNAGGKPFGRWIHEMPSRVETPPPRSPPPPTTGLSYTEEIEIASAFLHEDGRINRWLTKAQAKSIASFCDVGWREIRAACHPRPDVISDDESSDEEDSAQTIAGTGDHEEASSAGIENQQNSSTPAGQSDGASSGSGPKRKGTVADDEEQSDSSRPSKRPTPSPGIQNADAGELPDDMQPVVTEPSPSSALAHPTASQSREATSRPGPSKAKASASRALTRRKGVRDAEPQLAPRRNPPRAARFQASKPAAPTAAAAPSRTRAPQKPTKAMAEQRSSASTKRKSKKKTQNGG